MLRWIFWILIALWLISKLKYLFNDEADASKNFSNENPNKNNINTNNTANKHLKNDAGDYVDYEELH